jgi:hypothetical protein
MSIGTINLSLIGMIEIKTVTHLMHPSHIAKGYFILQVGNYYYPFCRSIMLENIGYTDYKECVKSFNGRL